MNNKKGFTLAELLIVVAIIAVLVAIAIPIFTTQLERSREATDISNARAALAELMDLIIEEPEPPNEPNHAAISDMGEDVHYAYSTVHVRQKVAGWQGVLVN